MLADLIPFMTNTVQHWYPPKRDIYGAAIDADYTTHRARLVYMPGIVLGGASNQDVLDAAVTIWLIDHPRPVAIGDTFQLDTGEIMQTIRIERRILTGAVVTKAFVK